MPGTCNIIGGSYLVWVLLPLAFVSLSLGYFVLLSYLSILPLRQALASASLCVQHSCGEAAYFLIGSRYAWFMGERWHDKIPHLGILTIEIDVKLQLFPIKL